MTFTRALLIIIAVVAVALFAASSGIPCEGAIRARAKHTPEFSTWDKLTGADSGEVVLKNSFGAGTTHRYECGIDGSVTLTEK